MEIQNFISTQECDYLREDEPVRGQQFALISFVSPERLLLMQDNFNFGKFLQHMRQEIIKDEMQHYNLQSPEEVDSSRFILNLNNIDELVQRYIDYKTDFEQELSDEYHIRQKYQTSMRGFKIRRTCDTEEEASHYAKQYQKIDGKYCSTYRCDVGRWCPWDPSNSVPVEYQDQMLNTLMKEKVENIDKVKEHFDQRLQEARSSNGPGRTNPPPSDMSFTEMKRSEF